jgi:predicted DNA-binding transcriptional regulator AlpA
MRGEPMTEQKNDRLLMLAEVAEIVAIPSDQIEKLCRAGKFPKPVRISRRFFRWYESEVLSFLQQCPRGME